MKTFSIKCIDGNRIDVKESDLITSHTPVDQFLDRLKVITIVTKYSTRYINADAIVCIKEREDDEC